MYSYNLPSTSALDGVGGQCHAPAALPPGKARYPIYRRVSGPQDRSGRERKLSPPPEFDPRIVQLVVSCYSDRAIPAHGVFSKNRFLNFSLLPVEVIILL